MAILWSNFRLAYLHTLPWNFRWLSYFHRLPYMIFYDFHFFSTEDHQAWESSVKIKNAYWLYWIFFFCNKWQRNIENPKRNFELENGVFTVNRTRIANSKVQETGYLFWVLHLNHHYSRASCSHANHHYSFTGPKATQLHSSKEVCFVKKVCVPRTKSGILKNSTTELNIFLLQWIFMALCRCIQWCKTSLLSNLDSILPMHARGDSLGTATIRNWR